jgi:hypothetical protein
MKRLVRCQEGKHGPSRRRIYANILILAGVIFLAVGLFGRVGGFIGSILGNIEAGKNSRVLAGVLGVLLIVGGGWLHEESHKSAASVPSPVAPASRSTPAPSTSPAGTASPSVVAGGPHESPSGRAMDSTPSPRVAPSAPGVPVLAADRKNLPASPSPAASDDRLIGTWTDLTPDGGRRSSIKRIEITRVGQGLAAHIWHFCPAGECDYGIHKLEISGTAPVYDFTLGDRRYVGSLNLYASGVVISSIDVFEPGTSNRWHHNRGFAKSTLSEKGQSAFIRYFDAPSPKASVMAPGGAWSFRFGKSSVEDAAQDALQRCQERGFPGCRVILLNNDAAE